MGFKVDHDGAVGGRNVYLMDGRNQVACQPVKIKISLAISLGDVGLPPKIGYLRNLVVHHLDRSQSCRRRSGWSITLRLRVTLVVANGRLGVDERILVSLTSHGERGVGAAQRGVNVKQ
jgi:hypothetical protein